MKELTTLLTANQVTLLGCLSAALSWPILPSPRGFSGVPALSHIPRPVWWSPSHIFQHLQQSEECRKSCSAYCFSILDHGNSNFQVKIKEALQTHFKQTALSCEFNSFTLISFLAPLIMLLTHFLNICNFY